MARISTTPIPAFASSDVILTKTNVLVSRVNDIDAEGTVFVGGGGVSLGLLVAGSDAHASIIAAADYVCDGTADNVQLQAAIDTGRNVIAVGTFDIAATVTIKGDFDGRYAAFETTVTNISPCLRVGITTGYLEGYTWFLPRVTQVNKPGSPGWNAADMGIELRNLSSCIVHIPEVARFQTGVLATANGTRGFCYNAIHINYFNNNKVQLKLSPADSTSWVNEDTWYCQRFFNDSAEGEDVVGARHLLIDDAVSTVNNHRFIGASFEEQTPEYHVETYGFDNQFIGCRWEASPPKVHLATGVEAAQDHQFIGGYGVENIVFTVDAGASYAMILASKYLQWVGTDPQGVIRLENGGSGDYPVITAVNAGAGLSIDYATAYGFALGYQRSRFKDSADTVEQFRIDHFDGNLNWGSGSAATDVTLGRAGANVLATADRFSATDGITTKTKAGVPVDGDFASTPADGTVVIDTTNSKIYVRIGGTWKATAALV